jgi:hypothetical protein
VWNAAGFIQSPQTSLTVTVAGGLVATPEVNPASCSFTWVNDGTVVVTVKYDVPIFVPFVDHFFASKPGARTMWSTVTMRVAPCTITKGA